MCVASRSPTMRGAQESMFVCTRMDARGSAWAFALGQPSTRRGERHASRPLQPFVVQMAVKIRLWAVTVCTHDDDSLKTTIKYSDWFKF